MLLILLDDVGFGMCSTFGGPVPTPHMDKLANNGLKYTRFHTTALCSPTRAALLAGRNHHSCGTGVIIEMGTGYPGYTGIIPQSTALVSEMLRDNGYATGMFGKWHNTPEPDISPAGPFDRWPTGLGFDYFYGFNQGETNQYYPMLYRNTTWVPQPKSPEQGYHFTADMTDEAIAWTRNVRAADPDKPWFVYFSTSGVHAPHHAPKEWRDKYAGKFDHGWDKQRELTHAKQLEMGIIPKGTKLTPRPKEIPVVGQPARPMRRRSTRRLMENYAGVHGVHRPPGRPADRQPASRPASSTTRWSCTSSATTARAPRAGWKEPSARSPACSAFNSAWRARSSGSTRSAGRRASRTSRSAGPGRWTPRSSGPSRSPATSAAPATRWSSTGPRGSRRRARSRTQFHHVIDVVPTILEACKIPEPKVVNGIPQKPIEGVSMLYSFDDANAKGRRTTQYFELATNRAIYHDGWVACSRYGLPWETAGRGDGLPQGPVGALQHRRGLQPGRRPGREEAGEAQGAAGQVPRGGEEVRRVPARPAVLRADGPEAARGRRAEDELDLLRQQRLAARADRPATLPARPHHHRRADDSRRAARRASSPVPGRSRPAGRSTSRTASRTSATRSSTSPT